MKSATVSKKMIPPPSAGLLHNRPSKSSYKKMKDAERDAAFSSFIDRKGEIINGIVQRLDRNDIIVNLGHTEGLSFPPGSKCLRNHIDGEIVSGHILWMCFMTPGVPRSFFQEHILIF